MSVASIPDSLREFLKDLSAVRAQKQVSLDDLQGVTKVYPHIITEFEQTGLHGHPLFNNVYVRAFVRSYAKAIGLPADEVARLYGKAAEGTYQRELAVSYLGLAVEDVDASAGDEKSTEPVFKADRFDFEVPASPASSRVTWVAAETKKTKPDLVERIRALLSSVLSKESALIQWGTIAVGAGIGLVLIFQLLAAQQSGEDSFDRSIQEEAATVVPESVETVEMPDRTVEPEVVVPAEPFVLGDSLNVFVIASSDKLDPFRSQVDGDLRRPYWLDQGDSMRFRMASRIVIEDNLDAMQILLEGFSYPIYSTDSTARVVITRDTAQAFLARRY